MRKLKLLLKYKTNPNIKASSGLSALSYGIELKNLDYINTLIKNGLDLERCKF